MNLNPIIPIAFHNSFRLALSQEHRFPMEKYELLPQQLILEGTNKIEDFFEPKPALLKHVLRVHDKNYVNRLLKLTLTKNEIRSIGFPLTNDLIRREFLIAG